MDMKTMGKTMILFQTKRSFWGWQIVKKSHQAETRKEEIWVHSEDFHDDGYEVYNGELPRDSEWGLSDVANGEPAEREDFAEKKFNGAVDTYEETDDWNVAENSETVGDDVEKDLADEKGESRGKHADILS